MEKAPPAKHWPRLEAAQTTSVPPAMEPSGSPPPSLPPAPGGSGPMSGPSGSPPTSAYNIPASKLQRVEVAANAGVTAADDSVALSSEADLAAFDLDGAITAGTAHQLLLLQQRPEISSIVHIWDTLTEEDKLALTQLNTSAGPSSTQLPPYTYLHGEKLRQPEIEKLEQ
eukprot:6348758-Prymnesium_polylepis.1